MAGKYINYIAIIAFIFGVSMVTFLYGVSVGVLQIYPYDVLRESWSAATALKRRFLNNASFVHKGSTNKKGVTVYAENRAFNGLTYFVAHDALKFRICLIDMTGKVLHEWHPSFDAIFPKAPHLLYNAGEKFDSAHGLHLYENGDVVFSFESGGFPIGGGLVKLDKDSKVVWALPRNTHHDLQVMEDGTIYACSLHYIRKPIEGIDTINPPIYDETILKVSAEGKVLYEISILEAIKNSDYAGLLSMNYFEEQVTKNSFDPLHNNSAEVLTAELAAQFPQFKAGDLLVSLRNLNTIAVIDPEERSVKWALSGKFVRQHDPDFLPNGNILLFDNRGHRGQGDGSQILEIDPKTGATVWQYRGSDSNTFYSRIKGQQQLLPNGNILVTETMTGRIFEVTKLGEIVWEFINGFPGKGGGRNMIGEVENATRVPKEYLTFLSQ